LKISRYTVLGPFDKICQDPRQEAHCSN